MGSIYSPEIEQNKICGFISSLVYVKQKLKGQTTREGGTAGTD